MTDLDQRISDILRQRAEGAIDIDRLTARAVAGGRRRRRHRRAVLGGAVALVALLGGVVVGPRVPGVDRPFTGAPPAVPAGAVPPLLPAVPGAADAPETIGTDAGVVHFGIDTAKARYRGWQVWGYLDPRRNQLSGVESVRMDVGDGRDVTVELARSSQALRSFSAEGVPYAVSELADEAAFDGRSTQLTVDGLPVWVRQWHPAPGVYARASVSAPTDTGLTVAVQALRLTEARRCAAPVRLTDLPSGANLHGCLVDVSAFPKLLTARFTISGPDVQATMTVSYLYEAEAAVSSVAGNTKINGRAALLYSNGGRLELLGFPKSHLLANYGSPEHGFDQRDAAVVLGGAQVAPDPTRPETWD